MGGRVNQLAEWQSNLTFMTRRLLPIWDGSGVWGKRHLVERPGVRLAVCGCIARPYIGAAVGECVYGADATTVAVEDCEDCVAWLRGFYVRVRLVLSYDWRRGRYCLLTERPRIPGRRKPRKPREERRARKRTKVKASKVERSNNGDRAH